MARGCNETLREECSNDIKFIALVDWKFRENVLYEVGMLAQYTKPHYRNLYLDIYQVLPTYHAHTLDIIEMED